MKRLVQNSVIILAIAIITAFPSLELTAKKGLKIDYSEYEKKAELEMVVQNGHAGSVTSVSFSPDVKFIVSGSIDNTMKLWSVDGKLVRTFKGHSDWINSVSFSPDGKFIASGSSDNSMKLWSVDGKLVRTFKGHSGRVYSVSFSPDGKFIASGSWDRTIRLWSVDGKLVNTFKEYSSDMVHSVSFSPDGKYVASNCWKDIRLWSIDGRLVRTFKGHSSNVTSVSFSPDGKFIASGSWDRTIKLWTIDGKLVRTLKMNSRVERVSFSPDGEFIASTGLLDKIIKLWSVDGELVRTFTWHSHEFHSVSLSPDGKFIASGSLNGTINLWSVDGKPIRTFMGHPHRVDSVFFSPNGEFIASGSTDQTIKLWSVDGKLVRTFKGHSGRVYSVSFSPDGKFITSGSWDKTVKLWSIDGPLLMTFKGHPNTVESTSFSPDGKFIASGSDDKTIKLWSIDGRLVRTFKGHSSNVTSVSFSPDGKFIASGSSDKTIKLWTIDGGLVRTFNVLSYVLSVSFSPDGKLIASGSTDQTIKLWSVDGKVARAFNVLSRVLSVSFSPDGKLIASGSTDQTIKLWSVEGNLVRTFRGHSGSVNSVSFSPDGKLIASGSEDTTIKIWDVFNGKCLFTLSAIEDNYIVYTPDGYWDGSRKGGKLVAMVKGLSAWGIDQFAIRNNRPDIILERIGIGTPELIAHYREQYKKRVQKLEKLYGIKESDLSRELHVPETEIIGKKENGKFIDIKFRISDSKYTVKAYNIYVNDVPIFGAFGKKITGRDNTLTEKIELTSGENKIEISCLNVKGAESYRALTYVDYNKKVKGDLYYIGFGVSDYKDNELDLGYAHQDALDLAESFKRMEGGQFDRVYCKTYTNEQVTLKNIQKAKAFLKNARVDDTFVLFIAGHGMHDNDKEATYYYMTHNANSKNLSKTAAKFELIEDLLQEIAPRNKLFLMDTCESGEIEEESLAKYVSTEKKNRGVRARTIHRSADKKRSLKVRKRRSYLLERDRFIYNDLFRRSGAIVFSSCKGDEVSYEHEELRNGFFTEAIVRAFTGKKTDKNNDGVISSDELRDFVMNEVPRMCRNFGFEVDEIQHPTVDRDNIYQKFGFSVIN